MAVLLIVGWVWIFIDRKNATRKKTPWILIAVGSLMFVVFFLLHLLKVF